ncbi:furin-like protease 2 [Centruroides sculpturatus]|uniref:furin-like protease 2 n=1 Tax=Centruroides sculpturatus TaxID=218467 RepID=UPI000C6EA818|nr:furin-like protease 2 [Centruroides sculpturatus]
MNVLPVWKQGISGKGVVVTILDDGIQTNHPDLVQNYNVFMSTISNNLKITLPEDNDSNKHGTRCAGEVAATAFNEFCGVGIAYNASIGGVRMLDGTVTDEVEATALSLNPNHIDIYSASWGPEDDGKTVDGPGKLAKQAFIDGVNSGRNGLGSIFVWASGNGGRYSDNCNCDGYTNSIYTLSISSATQGGLKPWYLEECSSTLATTYSSGTPGRDRSVVTVDMDMSYFEGLRNGRKPNPFTLCTRSHTGTSASAPIAAAICALALEANRFLSWRDMQHLVVLTSRPEPLLQETGWQTNGVGNKVSHKFGYGLMDATAMVKLAKQWTPVGKQHICNTPVDNTERVIPNSSGEELKVSLYTKACAGRPNAVRYLEHVQVLISLYYKPRGNLHIRLISPSGTSSSVLLPRPRDTEDGSLNNWPLLSVHFWGEPAEGKWTLIINTESHRSRSYGPGKLQKWSLILYGTETPPPIHLLRSNHPYRFNPLIRETSENSKNPCKTEDEKSGKKFFDPESGKCVEECRDGKFENKTYNICSPCNFSCLNCFGPNSDNCLSCIKSYYLQEDFCVQDCSDGYYKDEETNECLPCISQCMLCENNPSYCLSCKIGLYLFENHCVPECPEHTYHDSEHRYFSTVLILKITDTLPICSLIDYSLQKFCDNSLIPGVAVSMGKNVLMILSKCDIGCKNCNQEKCYLCDKDWKLQNGYCIFEKACKAGESCVTGYKCSKTCKECNGPRRNDCTDCDFPSHYLFNGECVSECPDGYFANQYHHCQLCHITCLKCIGHEMGQCQACIQGYVLHGGNCLPDCPKGFYKSDMNNCEPCDKSCLTCLSGTNKNCTTCKFNKYLINGMCRDEKCPESYYLRELPDGKECLPCHHSCKSCSGPGPTACLSCPDNATFRKGVCISCLHDEYFDQDTKFCEHCHPSCGRCFGPAEDQCLSCLIPLKFDVIHHRCLPCCQFDIANSLDCCTCTENSDVCVNSDNYPRSVVNEGKDKDKLQLSGDISESSNIAFTILMVCSSAVMLFLVIFGILQASSLGWCRRFVWNHSYKRVPEEITSSYDSKMEKVLLTQHDQDDEEDDIYCKM